jgi:choline dehydrogenase-like flavoprotein
VTFRVLAPGKAIEDKVSGPLFVMDASGFTSNPCQNPTLTIMALCVRSCDYLMGEMKRGNI